MNSVFFANSGAEAVENALRVARQATSRDGVICFMGGYHGRTTGTLAITTSGTSYRGKQPGPMPAGQVIAPYPCTPTSNPPLLVLHGVSSDALRVGTPGWI